MKKHYWVSRMLYILLQWTWGIVQNAGALMIFLALLIARPRAKRFIFHGAIVTYWNIPYSMGCGMFIFFGHHDLPTARAQSSLVHEYGHTIQSVILGPFYLPVIALPSVIWATVPLFEKIRRKKKKSYYDLYCEAGANRLGEQVIHERVLR